MSVDGATKVSGSCLCGALSFECDLPSLWAGHCHCSQCQRYHGAAFVTWVGFNKDNFHLTSEDASDVSWFKSSDQAERGFCSKCGSSVLFRSERWPEEMHVCLANIEGSIDREPAGHVHTESRVSWIQLKDDLPEQTGDNAE